jgi:hypothetical protein
MMFDNNLDWWVLFIISSAWVLSLAMLIVIVVCGIKFIKYIKENKNVDEFIDNNERSKH